MLNKHLEEILDGSTSSSKYSAYTCSFTEICPFLGCPVNHVVTNNDIGPICNVYVLIVFTMSTINEPDTAVVRLTDNVPNRSN